MELAVIATVVWQVNAKKTGNSCVLAVVATVP
jgi:hypothetical protein